MHELSIVVPTFNSERYIDLILQYYRSVGVEVTVFVDSKSEDETKAIAERFARVIPASNIATRVGEMVEWISWQAPSSWILRIDDDELPTISMLSFATQVVRSNQDVDAYGFARHQCMLSSLGEVLKHRKHAADAHRQWRLYNRERVRFRTHGHSPGFYLDDIRLQPAPDDACLVHLDWVVHSYEERLEKIRRYDAHTPGDGTKFRQFYLYEDDAELAAQLLPLAQPEFARVSHSLRNRFPDRCIADCRLL